MIEIYGLDSAKVIVKLIPCLNIQWNRRYYEAGDYAIQLRAEDWSASIQYIYSPQRRELGLVQKTETESTVKGNFVTVSGFFLEGMFNWKPVFPPYRQWGVIDVLCWELVEIHMTDVGVITKEDATLGEGAPMRPEVGTPLGDALYAALEAQGLSQRIDFDYDEKSMVYHVWAGKSRTMGQTTNGFVLISANNGTCWDDNLVTDDSDKRNVCYLAHTDGTATYTYDARTLVGGVPTEPLRGWWQDSGMVKAEGQSDASFNAELLAEAKRILAEHAAVINFDCALDGDRYRYLTDYDLGDVCEIRHDPTRRAYVARIIEINEVLKNGVHTVSAQFGNKKPVTYGRKWRR